MSLFRQLVDDATLKYIFDHLRNVFLCSGFFLMAAYILELPSRAKAKGIVGQWDMSSLYLVVALLIATGTILFLLNLANLFIRLRRTGLRTLRAAAVIGIYLNFAAFALVVALIARRV